MATFAGTYVQFSASGNVSPNPTSLLGIFVSAASAIPTIAVFDDSATGTTIKLVDTFTPIAGSWYPLPFQAKKGLNIVVSGTVSATVSFC